MLAGLARASRWPAVLLGVSIPVSIAADNILAAFLAIACAVALARADMRTFVLAHPVARASLLVFALLAVGTLYGERHPGDAARYLSKYRELVLIPLMLVAFVDPRTRRLGLYSLTASLLITLALSIALASGALAVGTLWAAEPGNAAVFKRDLTHNFLMAYGAFLFLQFGLATANTRARVAWLACAALAAADVLLLVRGRTGYVVLFALALYSGYAWKGARGLLAVSGAAVLAAAVLLLTPNMFSARVARTLNEAQNWETRGDVKESTNMRLEWYRNTIGIVSKHPLVGSGTGAFPKAYADYIEGRGQATVNPHNEYLHIAVQIGLVGVAALLWLFFTQWRGASRLASALETHLARGLLIAFALGCLFNSLLLDHTEGLFYAWLSALLYGGYAARAPASAA